MSIVPGRTRILVVTGVSGAGKSTVLKALEDSGYYCIDNLPTIMVPEAVRVCEQGGFSKLALGIDVRVRQFLSESAALLGALEVPDGRAHRDVGVIFCDATDDAILRRFSETRRPHTLASIEGTSAIAVLDGLNVERELLAPLRARATTVFDTTHLSVHELRRAVVDAFGPGATQSAMRVRILSFGFKYGVPADADIVLDSRFLANPYFQPALRAKTGESDEIRNYVLAQPDAIEFLDKIQSLLAFAIPRYRSEGKSYLTVAIGCTGGKHRSVVLVLELAARLGASPIHRDLHRAENRSG